MNTCICDKCKAEIIINIQEVIIDPKKENIVKEQFFICPKCSARYTILIEDNYIRKRIAERKWPTTSGRYSRRRDKRLVSEMQEHIKQLKAKYNRE